MPKNEAEQAEVVALAPPVTGQRRCMTEELYQAVCQFVLRGAAPPGTPTHQILAVVNDLAAVPVIEVPLSVEQGHGA